MHRLLVTKATSLPSPPLSFAPLLSLSIPLTSPLAWVTCISWWSYSLPVRLCPLPALCLSILFFHFPLSPCLLLPSSSPSISGPSSLQLSFFRLCKSAYPQLSFFLPFQISASSAVVLSTSSSQRILSCRSSCLSESAHPELSFFSPSRVSATSAALRRGHFVCWSLNAATGAWFFLVSTKERSCTARFRSSHAHSSRRRKGYDVPARGIPSSRAR